ncbi:MAG: hypothetical protein H6718_19590 [Polyangiaceae bacterium]|nr:hypothetical protein [Polyangiaceae bacterium]MCB9605588.1 hypothetical protein [Polyangiaceae bacterium]
MSSKLALRLSCVVWGAWLSACSPAADRPPPPLPPAISASVAPEPAAPPSVSLEVALLDGDPSRLAVRLKVPRAILPPGTKLLELPLMDAPFREAEGFVSFLKMADGTPYAGQFPVSTSETAPELALDIAYTVDLSHERAGPRNGIDAVPFKTTTGWFLAGRAFIPTLKADGVLLDVATRLSFPHAEASDASGALPEAGREGTTVALRDAFYVFGESNVKNVVVNDRVFRVMSGDLTPDARLTALVRNTVTLASQQLGPLDAHPRLVTLNLRETVRAGGSVGYDTSVVGPAPPEGPDSRLGQIVIHELLHQWSQADVTWLSEGFTHYFELKAVSGVAALTSAQREARALERFLPELEVYQLSVDGKPLREAQGNAAYAGGAMLAFCLDVELVKVGSSLEAVYRAARDGGRGTTEKRFREAMAKFPKVTQRLDELLAVSDAFPLTDCLERSGAKVTRTEYQGMEPRDLALNVLKVSGFNVWDTLVENTPEASKFEPGDQILTLNGNTAQPFALLPWMLRSVRGGQRFRVVVQRGETTESLDLVMPKLDPKQRPKRVHLSPDATAEASTPLLSWAGAIR